MKKITTLLVFFSINVFLYAQTSKEVLQSNTELFSLKSGTLIEKTFIDIGKQNKITFQVLKINNLLSGDSLSALRLETEVMESAYSTDTKVAILDKDELDGLISSIAKVLTSILPNTRENYTEVIFRSRSGFEFGSYYEPSKESWRCFFKLKQFDSRSSIYFGNRDLVDILSIIKSAKTKM